MLTKASGFSVRLIKDTEELQNALEFIERISLERHQANAPPFSQFLFAAYDEDGKIIGAVSVEFGSDAEPLPIEGYWRFDRQNTPFPFQRNLVAQNSHWRATRPGVSQALIFVSAIFAIAHGRKYYIVETKPFIAAHAATLGFLLLPIKDAEPVIDNIPESGRLYYLTSPQPALYMMDLNQLCEATGRKLELLRMEFTFSFPSDS